MKDKIEQFIKERHENSGGSNGTYIVQIISEFKIGLAEIKPILNTLYQEGKIKTCNGINGTMVVLK